MSLVGCQINLIDVNFQLQKSLEIFDKNSADKIWTKKDKEWKGPPSCQLRLKPNEQRGFSSTYSHLSYFKKKIIKGEFSTGIFCCHSFEQLTKCNFNYIIVFNQNVPTKNTSYVFEWGKCNLCKKISYIDSTSKSHKWKN